MTKYAHDQIPGPEPHYLLGNVPDILPDSLGNMIKLHDKYGPIVHLSMGGTELLSVDDPDVLETICEDNEYFTKEIESVYSDLAILNGRGLVTTSTADPDWQLGHKLIMNAFSARAMKAYHYKMGESISELCEIMESFAKSGQDFDVSRWFIALALESIGKIGFDYDFDLLKDPDAPRHPFTVALAYVQSMIMKRASTLSWLKWYQTTTNVRFHRDLQTLRGTVEDVLKDRREHPHKEGDQSDLLDFMIKAETKEGEKLNDSLIRDNIITFLSAGHNTTSAFLSWTLLELCKHPEVVENIKQEIANCGIKAGQVPTPEQVKECKYLDLVIKESLRIHPPITSILKYCKKDTTVKASNGDEYEVKAGQLLQVNINALHHNPKVWEDPDVFNPDRFSGDIEHLPNTAWLTFSTGPRACIGRQFALQEGKLALVMILSRFNFKMDDPNQKIGYAVVVSTKPVGFFTKIEDAQLPEPTEEVVVTKRRESKAVPQEQVKPAEFPLPPVTFLFGTQTNTSEEYARKLSGQAKGMGFTDVTVQDLDDWKLVKGEAIVKAQHDADAPSSEDDVKVSELVVVVTATYNGFPPDDATEFAKWLDEQTKDAEATKANMLSGMLYAVFGCGNRDWTSTFQKFPKKVDSGFELLGGERLLPAGEGDASDDIDGDFSLWSANFWTALMQRYGQSSSGKNADIMSNNGPAADPTQDFTLEFINIVKEKVKTEQAALNRNQLETMGTIVENRELQHTEKSHRSTRHIQVQFDKSVDGKPLYEAGDHLEIVPVNEDRLVEIIATNLGLVLDSVFEVKDLDIKNLSPRSVAANIKGPCTIRNALKYYADLTGPPTRFSLSILSKQLENSRPDIAERLQKALQPGKETQRLKDFLASHRTLIDIIQAFKIKELNFKEFISSVNCIVPRKYSISSGPLEHPFDPSISVGVVDSVGGPDGNTHYFGLASGFLSHQEPGTKINAQIKPCKSTFRLPDDPSTPVIFIAAGTGFSPFRGFLQERHAKGLKSSKKNSNGEGSECYMFFGCRHPDQDFIYKEEFDAYLEDGTITELYTTFSRSGEVVKYVQHALLRQANLLYKLMEESNAKVYICGSAGSMAKDVKRTWERLLVQMSGVSESEAAEQIQVWVDEGKYNEDVWGT